jgi:sugar phosphate isomerase/epimerase
VNCPAFSPHDMPIGVADGQAMVLGLSLCELQSTSGQSLNNAPQVFRDVLAVAPACGIRAITLDGTAQGMRARQLDGSARRDIAAHIRRHAMNFTGIDMWIPPEHFISPALQQRAMDAINDAADLAENLAKLTHPSTSARSTYAPPLINLVLPTVASASISKAELSEASTDDLYHAMVMGLKEISNRRRVVFADHSALAMVNTQIRSDTQSRESSDIKFGIDPAAMMLAGGDVTQALSANGHAIVAARLSDATTASRILPGDPGSRLDVATFKALLAAVTDTRAVTIDLRGLAISSTRQAELVTRVAERWHKT